MAKRTASTLVGLPLLLFIVWLGSPWFSILVGVAAAIGALEMARMSRGWGDSPFIPLTVIGAAALIIAGHVIGVSDANLLSAQIVVLAWAVFGITWLLSRNAACVPKSRWIVSIAAALYAGGLLFHAPLLREVDQGRDWVFFLLLVTFATDTGAFFVGRAIGRTPLAPTISPAKTREGAVGGFVAALGASVAAVSAFGLDAGLAEALILGGLIGIAGQIGDLAESRIKRAAGAKDSGWLVPGHGGLLDRLDSIVFNVVVVYYFVS